MGKKIGAGNLILFSELDDAGAFGEVYAAKWRGTKVAVKVLKDFLNQILRILKQKPC